MSFLVYNLASHLKHQERCYQEVNALMNDSENKSLTWFVVKFEIVVLDCLCINVVYIILRHSCRCNFYSD